MAPIVVEMFELRAEGKGISAICRILDEKGYDVYSLARIGKLGKGIIEFI